MAASEVAICNKALLKVGSETISALSNTSKRAIACNTIYAACRDEVLEAHPWNFAKQRVDLTADVTAPAFGYDFRFLAPTDCLLPLKVNGNDTTWSFEDRYILSDDTDCELEYTKKETDTTTFSPTFDEALACRIASELAIALHQKVTLADLMMKAYQAQLRQARFTNARAGGTPDQPRIRTWLDSRR